MMHSTEVRLRTLAKSEELYRRAQRVIPGCSQTFSKGPSQFIGGVSPKYLQRGRGSHVWDVDGNEYIDFTMALLPVILGYAHPGTTAAVERQLQDGISFTLPHPLEVELSELLVEIIPCAEMVRFGKNGSDATAAAVRVARAFTGRDVIVCCGYHGWQDWYIGTTTRDRGVPVAVKALTKTFQYNDLGSLDRALSEHPGRVAAVIMEPVIFHEPAPEFLDRVRELTHKHGALLVFDEIVTGFRFGLGGGQEYFGVTPDLACFGKGMANGLPISAIVGRADVMRLFEEVFFSGTFGGEALSLAASIATIAELREKNVVEQLWRQGARLRDGYNGLVRERGMDAITRCIGYAPWNMIDFTSPDATDPLAIKSFFQQEAMKRGILFSAKHNLCFAHSDEDISFTLDVYAECLGLLKDALTVGRVEALLEGPKVTPVFRTVG